MRFTLFSTWNKLPWSPSYLSQGRICRVTSSYWIYCSFTAELVPPIISSLSWSFMHKHEIAWDVCVCVYSDYHRTVHWVRWSMYTTDFESFPPSKIKHVFFTCSFFFFFLNLEVVHRHYSFAHSYMCTRTSILRCDFKIRWLSQNKKKHTVPSTWHILL